MCFFTLECCGLLLIFAASSSVKAHDKESPVSHTDRMVIATIRFEDVVSVHISVQLFSYLSAAPHAFLINYFQSYLDGLVSAENYLSLITYSFSALCVSIPFYLLVISCRNDTTQLHSVVIMICTEQR